MMSRHFLLSSELPGAIAKRLPHAKNQLSGPDNFFNQFVTDIYIYIYIYIYILTIKTRLMCVCVYIYIYIYSIYIHARFACYRCAAGGHFVSAGVTLRAPEVTID